MNMRAALVIALLLRIAWAVRGGEGPDEPRHEKAIAFFAEHGLPTAEELETQVPYVATSPLPYAPYVVGRWLHLPGRAVSVVLGVLLVYLGFVVVRRWRPELALPTAWLMAVQPQLCFQSSYVNWDLFTWIITTLFIASWGRQAWKTGVMAGLVLLCKPTGFAVLPVALLVFRRGWIQAALACVAVAGPFLLYNNAQHPGDPFGFNVVLDTTNAFWEPSQPAGWSALWNTRWLINTFESTWAVFGYLSIKVHNAFYVFFALMTVLALARIKWDRVHLVALACVCSSLVLSYAVTAVKDYQPYGRYLFPSVVPMFALYVSGLRRWYLALVITSGFVSVIHL